MFMAWGATSGDENAGHGMPCPYCPLPTDHRPLTTDHCFHDKCRDTVHVPITNVRMFIFTTIT